VTQYTFQLTRITLFWFQYSWLIIGFLLESILSIVDFKGNASLLFYDAKHLVYLFNISFLFPLCPNWSMNNSVFNIITSACVSMYFAIQVLLECCYIKHFQRTSSTILYKPKVDQYSPSCSFSMLVLVHPSCLASIHFNAMLLLVQTALTTFVRLLW